MLRRTVRHLNAGILLEWPAVISLIGNNREPQYVALVGDVSYGAEGPL